MLFKDPIRVILHRFWSPPCANYPDLNPSVFPTSIVLTAIATIHANPNARIVTASASASGRPAARVGSVLSSYTLSLAHYCVATAIRLNSLNSLSYVLLQSCKKGIRIIER